MGAGGEGEKVKKALGLQDTYVCACSPFQELLAAVVLSIKNFFFPESKSLRFVRCEEL